MIMQGLLVLPTVLILKIPHRGRWWFFRFHCSFNGRRVEYLYNSGRESNRLLCVTFSIWEYFLWDWLDTYLFQSTWITAGYHPSYILKMVCSLLQERPASFLMTPRLQVFNCLRCSQLPPVAWNIHAKVKNCTRALILQCTQDTLPDSVYTYVMVSNRDPIVLFSSCKLWAVQMKWLVWAARLSNP